MNPPSIDEPGFVEWLRQNYREVRQLPDGTYAGLDKLMFTTAVFVDLDRWGWAKRFCFEDHALAVQRFGELQSADDEPQGFIARRGG